MQPFLKLIILTLLPLYSVLAQSVLDSPSEAKEHLQIDYGNIIWTTYQHPHYKVEGFDRAFLKTDFYSLQNAESASLVLMQKINLYRVEMGMNRLAFNDTASQVAVSFAKLASSTIIIKETHLL